MKRLLFSAFGICCTVALVVASTPSETSAATQWTKNWHCQMSGGTNNHKITAASNDYWANGLHEYWPGNCEPHETNPE